jgi:hypothetical protein
MWQLGFRVHFLSFFEQPHQLLTPKEDEKVMKGGGVRVVRLHLPGAEKIFVNNYFLWSFNSAV